MSVEAETLDTAACCRGPARFSGIPRWLTLAVAVFVVTAAVLGGAYYWYAQRAPRQFAQARRALAAGRWDDVERALVRLEGHPAYEPHRHFLRAALLLEQGENLRALEEFGHSVEHPDLRVATLTLSGEAAYKAGYLQAAMGLLVRATELAPDSLPALRWLASAYYDLGLNDGTIETLTRVAELDPGDPRPHRLMGLIYKDFENYPTAVEHFRESLRRDGQQPDHQQILFDLADCEINLRRPEAALETLADALPGPDRWVREAECHYALGRVDEALKRLQTALDGEPAQLSGLLLWGTIASDQGDDAMAIEAFTRAVVAWPRDYVAHFKLSQVLRRAGNDAGADHHAQVADDIKRVREEFSKLHETAAREPENADVRCRLGIVAGELGRPDLARVWFRAALSIDSSHPETLRQLAGELPPDASGPAPSARGPTR